jgi:hypothetical protein
MERGILFQPHFPHTRTQMTEMNPSLLLPNIATRMNIDKNIEATDN